MLPEVVARSCSACVAVCHVLLGVDYKGREGSVPPPIIWSEEDANAYCPIALWANNVWVYGHLFTIIILCVIYVYVCNKIFSE